MDISPCKKCSLRSCVYCGGAFFGRAVIFCKRGEIQAEGRLGYRSGYYPRKLITRVGTLELRLRKDRLGCFGTEIFNRYQRSEKALVSALFEMYVQGVSTRKIKAISEELCGHESSGAR